MKAWLLNCAVVLALLGLGVPAFSQVQCIGVHEDVLDKSALEVLAPGLSEYQRDGVDYVLQFTSFRKLLAAYEKIRRYEVEGDNIFEKLLTALEVRLNYEPAQLAAIPKSGGLVVTSNHPYGGIDGIILMAMIKRLRPDVKFLAASMLATVPELRDGIIPVDFAKTREGALARKQAFENATRHVNEGGALVIFPAGGVAQARGLGFGRAVDTEWKPGAARILQTTGAASLSVRFPGQNSLLFQILGRIQALRPLFLGREVVNKSERDVSVFIGETEHRNWNENGLTAEQLTQQLRERSESLHAEK